jgi:hypothetical protein
MEDVFFFVAQFIVSINHLNFKVSVTQFGSVVIRACLALL